MKKEPGIYNQIVTEVCMSEWIKNPTGRRDVL